MCTFENLEKIENSGNPDILKLHIFTYLHYVLKKQFSFFLFLLISYKYCLLVKRFYDFFFHNFYNITF